MSGNIQDKLRRVRKPRVHITYEVETNGSMRRRELPFVVGVLGDFSGDPTQELKPFNQRRFEDINRDNFDQTMKSFTPGLNLRVANKLDDKGGDLGVNLKFESMRDFEPGRVAQQVPALKALMETRAKLRELATKADRSPELEALLEKLLQDDAQMKALSQDLGAAGAPATVSPPPGSQPKE